MDYVGNLFPGAVQQEVDECRHIVDFYLAIEVAVGGIEIDDGIITAQQVVDECCHVVDLQLAIAVDIAKQEGVGASDLHVFRCSAGLTLSR